MSDELRERAARALWETDGGEGVWYGDTDHHPDYFARAEAVLAVMPRRCCGHTDLIDRLAALDPRLYPDEDNGCFFCDGWQWRTDGVETFRTEHDADCLWYAAGGVRDV